MKKIQIIILLLFSLSMFSCSQSGRQNTKSNSHEKHTIVSGFNADSAYAFVAEQVAFGPRVPGTAAHDSCKKWLIMKLEQYGTDVTVQNFKARTYDQVTRSGTNIIGSINPDNPKRILLMSHWDSRPYADHDPSAENQNLPIDGANDGASGVGVLIELARQFQLKSPSVGVDILLFDLEDWGPPTQLGLYQDEYWGLGSQYWSKNPHVFGYQANFGILLDMVGAKDAYFTREYFSMQYAGFVVDKVWDMAGRLGYRSQFQNSRGNPINDDHRFVNEIAKIPSIDIIHLDNFSGNGTFFEHWHTTNDNLSQIDKASLKIVGEVVGSVVYNE